VRIVRSAVFVFVAVLSLGAAAQARFTTADGKAANLGFEEGEPGKVPVGWMSSVPGFSVSTVEGDAKEGNRFASIRLSHDGTKPGRFGNLMQVVDAAPYRGHWVRLRAAVRLKHATEDGQAQMWMRVDRPNEQLGFFDNMQDRPITSTEWKYYEISGDIADDAAALNFGVILLGDAEVLVDDVTITDLGKLAFANEAARAATARGLDNLAAFARLFGYVRHFHPSDEAAATDWNRFAVDGVRAVEPAADAAALASKLNALFGPIAPTLQIYRTGTAPKKNDALPDGDPARLEVVSWRHRGFGQPSTFYASERIHTKATTEPLSAIDVDLGGGVSARVPLAVYADAAHTLPKGQTAEPSTALKRYSGDDRGTRLADVILIWNVLEHFYPYFDVVKTDWNAQLRPALAAAAIDRDGAAFLTTLRKLIAQLHDGHGGVYQSAEGRGFALPVFLRWADDELAVAHVFDDASGMKQGDVIVSIDGRKTADWLRDRSETISFATQQWLRTRATGELVFGPKDSVVTITIRHAGQEPKTLTLRRSLAATDLIEPRPEKIHEMESGIWYVDLSRASDEDFAAALPKLELAKGVIFDLRGYPDLSSKFLTHIIDKPVQSAQWLVPIVTQPDGKFSDWDRGGRWNLQPAPPRVGGRIVFLTDGRAISYSESIMGIIEAYHLADIVGETTAGTNGNVNPVTLPGTYNVYWTGMRVLKHDGSQHHGIGIAPTVPVSPTVAGLTEGRDEQLEKAVSLIKEAK
jgi:C-terminal processing protease CtpA/Prc